MLKMSDLHSWMRMLPPPVRDDVLAHMYVRRFRDREFIYTVGDAAEESYFIRSGHVRIFVQAYDGKELLAVVLQAGDCFGEHAMIDCLPRFNSAAAVGDTELLALRRSDFDRLYAKHVEIARSLNRVFCYRFRLTFSTAVEASVLSLQQRVVRHLVRLANTAGLAGARGSVAIAGISHQGIALALGATRQAVSKVLKELEQEHAVRLDYRRITILSLARLESDNEKLISSNLAVPDYHQHVSSQVVGNAGKAPGSRRGSVASVRRTRRDMTQK
jgi:CRP/FNR family transcriptional regulator, cyclic AMP receptor protein